MKVTKTHIELCKTINELQRSTYRVGETDVDSVTNPGEKVGIYRELCDFAYNDFGQTPSRVCSFTAELAALISVTNNGFGQVGTSALITAISEEADGYLGAHAVAQYLNLLERACEHNELQPPEGLVELRARLQAESGATNLWG